jgi:adenine-specific DNA-methyltransferase
LRLYANHVIAERSQEDILYELLLKAGLSLTAPVTQQEIAGQPVYSVAGGQLLICLVDPITVETLRGMIDEAPQRIICLDVAFRGNDQLKTNVVLEMRSHNVEFHTV